MRVIIVVLCRGEGEVLRVFLVLVGGKKKYMCMKKKLRDELNGQKLNFDETLMLKLVKPFVELAVNFEKAFEESSRWTRKFLRPSDFICTWLSSYRTASMDSAEKTCSA